MMNDDLIAIANSSLALLTEKGHRQLRLLSPSSLSPSPSSPPPAPSRLPSLLYEWLQLYFSAPPSLSSSEGVFREGHFTVDADRASPPSRLPSRVILAWQRQRRRSKPSSSSSPSSDGAPLYDKCFDDVVQRARSCIAQHLSSTLGSETLMAPAARGVDEETTAEETLVAMWRGAAADGHQRTDIRSYGRWSALDSIRYHLERLKRSLRLQGSSADAGLKHIVSVDDIDPVCWFAAGPSLLSSKNFAKYTNSISLSSEGNKSCFVIDVKLIPPDSKAVSEDICFHPSSSDGLGVQNCPHSKVEVRVERLVNDAEYHEDEVDRQIRQLIEDEHFCELAEQLTHVLAHEQWLDDASNSDDYPLDQHMRTSVNSTLQRMQVGNHSNLFPITPAFDGFRIWYDYDITSHKLSNKSAMPDDDRTLPYPPVYQASGFQHPFTHSLKYIGMEPSFMLVCDEDTTMVDVGMSHTKHITLEVTHPSSALFCFEPPILVPAQTARRLMQISGCHIETLFSEQPYPNSVDRKFLHLLNGRLRKTVASQHPSNVHVVMEDQCGVTSEAGVVVRYLSLVDISTTLPLALHLTKDQLAFNSLYRSIGLSSCISSATKKRDHTVSMVIQSISVLHITVTYICTFSIYVQHTAQDRYEISNLVVLNASNETTNTSRLPTREDMQSRLNQSANVLDLVEWLIQCCCEL